MPKRYRLRNIKLAELSLVDSPANPHAHVALVKRREEFNPNPGAFADTVAAIKKRDGISATAAARKTRMRFPELYAAMQSNGSPTHRGEDSAVAKAIRDFLEQVDKIAAERCVPKSAAMTIARREHPAEFNAAYKDE